MRTNGEKPCPTAGRRRGRAFTTPARVQKITYGRSPRPDERRMLPDAERDQFARTPPGMASAQREQRRHHDRVGRTRAALRTPRAVRQGDDITVRGGPPAQPLVRRFATDAVCSASSVIVYNPLSYSRTSCSRWSMGELSRHGIETPPMNEASNPGRKCYPCPRTKVLPMCPD